MNADSLTTRAAGVLGRYFATWDRFWFTPRLPHTLGILRIVTGLMLLYSHLVLATELTSFLGDTAWVNNETARSLHDGTFGSSDFGRSYLWHLSNPLLLWMHHALTMLITACFAIGLLTRFTGPAAWFLQLMYLHRLTGALFGLDQIVTYCAMYLMFTPCGSCFSIDASLRKIWAGKIESDRRLRWLFPEAVPSVAANIATRLLQLHLCVIYLFGGLAKARGESWWDGTAVWYSVGNYEYQSIDMTWIGSYPRLFSAMTHVTLFWEVFYCALVWPRFSRPLVLAMAVAVHAGIALFLGMMTFGVMMIAANLGAFVEPQWMLRLLRRGEQEQDEQIETPLADDLSNSDRASEGQAAERESEADEFVDDLLDEDLYRDSAGQDLLEDDQSGELDWATGDSGIRDLHDSGRTFEDREHELRLAHERIQQKSQKLKERELKYKQRVKKLKEREAKIQRAVERRRAARAAGNETNHNSGEIDS